MGLYAVHFEFSVAVDVHAEPRHELGEHTLESAKQAAALLHATADFGTPPIAYSITQNDGAEVYRCAPALKPAPSAV